MASLIVSDFTLSVYTAAHVIISFSESLSLLYFVFLLIDIPMARWDVKKWIKKEKERNVNETYKVRRKC